MYLCVILKLKKCATTFARVAGLLISLKTSILLKSRTVDSIYDLVSSQMSLILRQSGTTRCLQCYSAHGSSSLFWSFCTWKQFPVFIIQFLLFCTCFYHSFFVILHQHSSLFLLFLFIIFHTEAVPCFCYFISSLLHIERNSSPFFV